MNDRYLLTLVLCLLCAVVRGADLPADSVGFARLHIETVGGEEPTCDFVFPPEGGFGISITNATKVPGRMVMTLGGDTLYDSGEYEKGVSGMTIKIRGNTSVYWWNLRPYKLKLQKKADLLLRNDGVNHKDKNWVLLHEGFFTLHAMVGQMVSRLLDMPWTPSYRYVMVYLNGRYLGFYMLCESVEQNVSARVDVDKDCGYIFERDAYWWNEDLWFADADGRQYTFKHPDPDEVLPAQVDYLKAQVDTMLERIGEGRYADVIDCESFARWLLAHDILGSYDSGGANIYLTRHDTLPDTKMMMGPLWDFDSNFRCTTDFARIHTDPFFIYPKLTESSDNSFARSYCELWSRYKDRLFSQIDSMLAAYPASAEGQALQRARTYDSIQRIYADTLPVVSVNIEECRAWFRERKEVLQQLIEQRMAPLGVERMPLAPVGRPAAAGYTLQGTVAPRGYKGIVLKGGKKYVAR